MTHTPDYADIELRILKKDAHGYAVELTVDGVQQFEGGELNHDMLPWIQSASPSADGERLFQWLFEDPRLLRAWSLIRGNKRWCRTRLRIDADIPQLHVIPWELLRDVSNRSAPQSLATDLKTPFTRYLAGEWRPGEAIADRPIKLLVAIANPDGLEEYKLPAVDVSREEDAIRAALAEIAPGLLEITFLEGEVSLPRLAAKLKKEFHLLHIVAHGTFSTKQQTGAIFLADDDNDVRRVKGDEFCAMLAQIGRIPELIFLCSCETANQSPADAFRAFGPSLVAAGAPAVVAMQDLIGVDSARLFMQTFYRQLFQHGLVDLACNEARAAIQTANLPGSGVPVLFSRLRDGRLCDFEVSAADSNVVQALPPPEPMRPPRIKGFVGRSTELATYATQLDEAGIAVIVGMIGVGKTALAATLARRRPSPQKTFWHTLDADGLEGLLWDLAGFLFWNDQPELWHLLKGNEQSAARLPATSTLFDHLCQMMRGRGYTLCLDDFHSVMDDTRLDMLTERLRPMIEDGELTLLLVSRRVPNFVQLIKVNSLNGLNEADSLALIRSRCTSLDEKLARQLAAYTEGNTAFLTIAVEALSAVDEPRRLIEHLIDERNVERYLLAELDKGLDPVERDVESAVALLAAPSTRPAIETTLATGDLRHPLRDLSERYLLTIQERGWERAYGQHAMLRDFYAEHPTPADRIAMHRRAAAYFEQDPQAALRAALHYEQAGEIAKCAQVATRRIWSIMGRYQARSLAQLLERLPQDDMSRVEQGRLQLAFGQVQAFLGQTDAARAAFHAVDHLLATEAAQPELHQLRAEAYRGLGQLVYNDAPQESLIFFERGLAELAASHKSDGESLVGEPATYPSGSEPSTVDTMYACYYIDMAWAYRRLHQLDVAEKLLQTGLELLPSGASQLRGDALTRLASVYVARHDLPRALPYADQAVENSRQLGDVWQEQIVLSMLANISHQSARWRDAALNYERALQLAVRLGHKAYQATFETNLGAVYVNLGDADAALRHLSTGVDLARQYSLQTQELQALRSLARLKLWLNDVAGAAHHLQDAETLIQAMGTPEADLTLPLIYALWSEVKLQTSGTAEAMMQAERAVNLAIEQEKEVDLAVCQRARAQVHFANQEYAAAQTLLAQSLSLVEGKNRYETAKTQALLGQSWQALGNADLGAKLLHQAQTTYRELGARFDLELLQEPTYSEILVVD